LAVAENNLVEGEAEDQPNEKLEGEDDEEDDISNEDRIVNQVRILWKLMCAHRNLHFQDLKAN